MRQFFTITLLSFLALLIISSNSNTFADRTSPLDFSLPDESGNSVRLSDFRGEVVVLNFWATWCVACLEEIPSLERFSEEYKAKDVRVLGISIDRDIEKLRSYLKRNPIKYKVLHDPQGKVFVDLLTVKGLPATYIIDPQGRVVEKITGKVDFDSDGFRDRVERYIKGGAR
ncbi:MAG: TlpA family protein disulfide reductase [Nitrospirae bacterium]|nr:MAG: TlpA family protein disulfide reductase [Nitrospirota bacterium]